MKKLLALILAFSVVCSTHISAYAHDVPQERDDCSIELIVRYNGTNINGGTLTAIKVGYVDEDDGNYFFAQEMTGTKIEDISSSYAPAVQKEFYEKNKGHYVFTTTHPQTVRNGKVSFTGLETGLYLIIQEEAAPGFNKLGAFLVSVPYMENDVYQYHVKATVKSELERSPTPSPPPPPSPPPHLPQTGQLNWPIPLMAIAGLTFFVAGWLLCFGKKREDYEK